MVVSVLIPVIKMRTKHHILETNRLLLRELTPNDAESFYLLNNNPNVIKYTGNTAFESIAEARSFLENYPDYALNGYGRWAVIHKSTGKFIGWCGLKYDAVKNETDIGFRFFEEEWNNGYATESACVCIRYGFEKLALAQIIGRAMKENSNSVKVLEKVGMIYKETFDFEGQEGVIYELTQQDFEQKSENCK